MAGIDELEEYVDTMSIIINDRLLDEKFEFKNGKLTLFDENYAVNSDKTYDKAYKVFLATLYRNNSRRKDGKTEYGFHLPRLY